MHTPEFIKFDPNQSLVSLFRGIIFQILQMSCFSEVTTKENSRDAIIDFLNAVLEYITTHYDDENSILDGNRKWAKEMQIAIISTVHKMKSDDIRSMAENGDIDVNKDLIKERTK
jgi:hypothetical protein